MKFVIGNQKSDTLPNNPSNDYKSPNTESKSVIEIVKLLMYICAKKLWRAQIIICLSFIVGSVVFLSLFWYETVRNGILRQKESAKYSDEVNQYVSRIIAKTHPVYYDDDLHTE